MAEQTDRAGDASRRSSEADGRTGGIGRPGEVLSDGAFALLAFVTTSLGFSTWYSRAGMNPRVFEAHYHRGIYEYRVLGRDIVWWLYEHVVRDHFPAGDLNPGSPGEIFPAMLFVNGVAFLAFVLATRAIVRRSSIGEPRSTLVVWTVAIITALSSYVITPYDNLSYALLAVFVLLALTPRWDARGLAVAVGVVGILNRETMFIGVAILAAAVANRPDDQPLRVVTIASAVAMAATYVLLRVTSSEPGVQIWESVGVADQLTNRRAWIGVGLFVVTSLVWMRVVHLCGLSGVPRRPLVIFYVLAAPYIVVSILTGIWFELRLIVPLIIGDLAVRCACRAEHTPPSETAPEVAPVAHG